jgi:hypothetical protein
MSMQSKSGFIKDYSECDVQMSERLMQKYYGTP